MCKTDLCTIGSVKTIILYFTNIIHKVLSIFWVFLITFCLANVQFSFFYCSLITHDQIWKLIARWDDIDFPGWGVGNNKVQMENRHHILSSKNVKHSCIYLSVITSLTWLLVSQIEDHCLICQYLGVSCPDRVCLNAFIHIILLTTN